MLKNLAFVFLLTITLPFGLLAQQVYSLSGTITSEKGEPLDAATVFINGTNKSTYTNSKGEYYFRGLIPGSYQVAVGMLGFKSAKNELIITQKNEVANFKLQVSTLNLNEVVVSAKKSGNNSKLDLLKKEFLGITPNGLACVIENPEIINFNNNTDIIKASSADFIVISNPNLGYRIKYLLKEFRYVTGSKTTAFDGECVFEELEGTEEQKQIWKENRALAYYGSLMHYLRSLYNNTTTQEGFITFLSNNRNNNFLINVAITKVDKYVNRTDKNFIELRIPGPLYVNYYPEMAKKLEDQNFSLKNMPYKNGSVIRLLTSKATIDSRGNYVDIKSFLFQLNWGTKRLGDRLPFEYTPE